MNPSRTVREEFSSVYQKQLDVMRKQEQLSVSLESVGALRAALHCTVSWVLKPRCVLLNEKQSVSVDSVVVPQIVQSCASDEHCRRRHGRDAVYPGPAGQAEQLNAILCSFASLFHYCTSPQATTWTRCSPSWTSWTS